MKNKLLCVVLSAALMLTMSSAVVFADEGGGATFVTSNGGSTTVDQKYTVDKAAGVDDGTVDYYVTVSWETKTGTATSKGDKYSWNASKKKYVRSAQTEDLENHKSATADIIITNQSNAKVNYWIEYATASGYDTTESVRTSGTNDQKSGTLESFTEGMTIENDGEIGLGEYDYSDVAAPSVQYDGQVTLNKQKTALSTETVVGTYTVKIGPVGATEQTVETTVDSSKDTTLTSTINPANSAAGTSVTFPSEITALTNESTANLTVEVTPILEAIDDTSFTVVTTNNQALGALDLTLKVNGEIVSNFEDSEEEAVPVKVITYVAKGITDFGFNYNGVAFTVVTNESDVDAANEVWYDSETGKLVFMTTHFSTYVVEGSNNAYCKDTNTACDFETYIADIEDGQTILLLKDCELSAKQIKTPKSFTLDLGGKTLTVNKELNFGYDSSYTKHAVDETIKNGTIVFKSSNNNDYGSSPAYLRFENGSKGTFENVVFEYNNTTGNTQAARVIQTYATNTAGSAVENMYTFKNCKFKNATTSFEGKSGSCNDYNISFDECTFTATNMSNGASIIAIDDYDYGDLVVRNSSFDINNTANSGYCVNIDTYLSYTNGVKFNATFDNVTMNTAGNANPYTYRFLSYNGGYSDNAVITDQGNNTYTHNGSNVELAIRETTATNKSVMWVENAEAFQACYAEWLAYAKASPACASYSSSKYYLVESGGHYFVGGQGTQFITNATITKDELGNVTQVKPNSWYTYNTIGTDDISTELGESDNTSVRIYTLAN